MQTGGEKFVLAVKDHRQFTGRALAILLADALRENPRMSPANNGFRSGGNAQAKGGFGV